MRCSAKIKAWNPTFINWNGKEVFKGKIFIYTNCPITTKITSAKCWRRWGLCGSHATQFHPSNYPKGAAPRKGGGRYGNGKNLLPFNQMVPIRVRKKSNKKIALLSRHSKIG